MIKEPFGENGVLEFLCLADQFDALATTVRTDAEKQGLERWAARFRVYAAQHAAKARSDWRSAESEQARPD